MKAFIYICSFSLILQSVLCLETIATDIVVQNVVRKIDIASQLAKITSTLSIENSGKSSIKSFIYAIEPQYKNSLAYLGARVEGSNHPLNIIETSIKEHPTKGFWRINLKEPLQPGKRVSVEVESVISNTLTPYPATITQKEKQLVLFNGNHLFYSPYRVIKQMTSVSLATKNVESFSKLSPVAQTDFGIAYGPYQEQKPYAEDKMVIHYENNSPFLKVTRLERTIEVSHWGNIAVEEIIDVVHTGSVLKGPFSRYEYQREAQSGVSSVKAFKTILPASAKDVYYRDEIGNISTSHMRVLSDSVELDLRPRFPLFGGWKTHYVLGYNVPSYEYLYNSGDNFKLKMRLIDHIYDDMVVEELITKVILPEGCHNIEIETPYPVQRLNDYLHYTYLDTKGRPVVTIRKTNVVENHIQDFKVNYMFPRLLMLQEPFLVVGFFYLFFLFIIIYVRLDFSITKDETSECKMRVAGICDKIIAVHEKRMSIYSTLNDLFVKLKTTRDAPTFSNAVKILNQNHKTETANIADLMVKLKVDSPEMADKVSELQKVDKQVKEYYHMQQIFYVDKFLHGKVNRAQFTETENSLNKKKEECFEKMFIILKNLQ